MANYISNKELTDEIFRCKETNRVSDKLARMLMLFVERYSMKGNWRNYSYRSEFVCNALMHLTTSPTSKVPPVLRFDPKYAERVADAKAQALVADGWLITETKDNVIWLEKTIWPANEPERRHITIQYNAFAFITQCIKNNFLRTLRLEKRENNIRDELLLEAGLSPSTGFMIKSHDDWVEMAEPSKPKPIRKKAAKLETPKSERPKRGRAI